MHVGTPLESLLRWSRWRGLQTPGGCCVPLRPPDGPSPALRGRNPRLACRTARTGRKAAVQAAAELARDGLAGAGSAPARARTAARPKPHRKRAAVIRQSPGMQARAGRADTVVANPPVVRMQMLAVWAVPMVLKPCQKPAPAVFGRLAAESLAVLCRPSHGVNLSVGRSETSGGGRPCLAAEA